jgi:hypothetical protein
MISEALGSVVINCRPSASLLALRDLLLLDMEDRAYVALSHIHSL